MAWIKAFIAFIGVIVGILAVIVLAIAALVIVPLLFVFALAVIAASFAYYSHKNKKGA